MFKNLFVVLQKIGKSLMLPVSVLPIAGILLGVGSAGLSWIPVSVSQVMAEAGGSV
ncbi:TPA: PTS glucose transporter subunit IIBC, partial [Proteus mirabilis]